MNVKEEDEAPIGPIGAAAGYESDVSLSPVASPQPSVKQEQGGVKREDGETTARDGGNEDDDEDDDKYEDALDLDTSKAHNKVWLIRMPRFLIDSIDSNFEQIAGKEMGKVRIQTVNGQPGRVRVLLDPELEPLRQLPHRYDLTMTQPEVNNTYLFKEQELPKPKKRPAENGDGETQEGGAAAETRRHSANAKRTALSGKVAHEFNLVPDFADPNYRNVIKKRREMELPQADRQTTLLDGPAGVGGMKYGTTLRQQRETWLRPQQRRQTAKTSVDGKATRMERPELLDLLFRLFEEIPHWTLKSLRERTKQPEVYLREVLDSIAFLNKRGPFAMRYGLREEFRQLQTSGASVKDMVDKAPPAAEESGNTGEGAAGQSGQAEAREDDDDDDDDMEMETVVL